MKCKDCPKFDKDAGCCGEMPSELDDMICLLRHACYMLNEIHYEIMEDIDEGDSWKFPA